MENNIVTSLKKLNVIRLPPVHPIILSFLFFLLVCVCAWAMLLVLVVLIHSILRHLFTSYMCIFCLFRFYILKIVYWPDV